jgi:hypothetical protein
MGTMRTRYTLNGDDRSPRAYLDGVQELLGQRLAERIHARDHADTQIERRLLSGEVRGLETARAIVDDVLAGLDG